MVSILRRKSRTYLYGSGERKGSRCNITRSARERAIHVVGNLAIGHMNGVYCERVVRYALALTFSSPQEPVLVEEFPLRRAEKSGCIHHRRKRGLRKGKSRSRGRQPRRSSPNRQPIPKEQKVRNVNHIGRKFIWAAQRASDLGRDCRKFFKIPRDSDNPLIVAHRKTMKSFLLAKWIRLHNRAEACGIPPQAAFFKSFPKFLAVQSPISSSSAWGDLLASVEPDLKPRGPRRFDSKGNATGIRPSSSPALKRGKDRPYRRR